jgi:hypothetical protein
VDLGEPQATQVVGERPHDFGLHLERRRYLRVAQAKGTVVEHRVNLQVQLLLGAVHLERQLRHRFDQHLHFLEQQFGSPLGLRLGLHRTVDLNQALTLQMRKVVLSRVKNHRLRGAGTVSDYDERYRAQLTDLKEPAHELDVLTDVLADVCC